MGYYLVYDYGLSSVKKVAAQTLAGMTSFRAFVIVGKCLRVGSKLDYVYRFGTMLYNGGMKPFQFINLIAQAPLMTLDIAS